MRKVSNQSVMCFCSNETASIGNTTITRCDELLQFKLHNNIIAQKNLITGKVYISNCGWETPTTKERLNAIILLCGTCKTGQISQKKGVWYWKNKEGTTEPFPFDCYVSIN